MGVMMDDELPVVPLMGDVLFPHGVMELGMSCEEWERRAPELEPGPVLMVAVRPGREHWERARSLYRFGTVAALVPERLEGDVIHLVTVGIDRAKVDAYYEAAGNLHAVVRPVPGPRKGKHDERSLLDELRLTLRHIGRFDPMTAQLFEEVLTPIDDPWQLTDLVAANLLDSVDDRQRVLETRDPLKRVGFIREHLRRLELTYSRAPWTTPAAFLN